jgi:endonuclease/exonuclease/phosphatase family metal-dependent hydrolase
VKFSTVLLTIPLLASVALGTPKCPDRPLQQGSYVNEPRTLEEKDLTVVSLNMAKEKVHDKILRDLRKAPFFETADIWLLQEVVATIPEIARTMGLNYVYAPTEDSGLAILSRYPIGDPERIPLSQHNLIFRSRCRIALSARIQSLEVVNVHLDTRIGKQQRLDQASPLLSGDRRIVGGDFNTSNIRWIMHLLPVPGPNHSRAMRDMFVAQGFESPLDQAGSTFKFLHLPLHLDWIFPKDLKTVAAGVEKIDFSDHHAVWVSLEAAGR